MAVDLPMLNFLLHNFLKTHIACVAIFNCWDAETQLSFSEMAANNYLYTQYVNIDEGDNPQGVEHRLLKHKRPVLGAVLDINCIKSEEMLNMLSYQRLFTENYHWLLYDHAANITNFQRLFENANLSVNADLTYAIMKQENANYYNSSFILYDVYNNGRYLGGKLNITIDREIICNASACALGQYLSKLHKRTKYGNRNRLHDITMRATTVVSKYPIDAPEPKIQEFLRSENNTRIDGIVRFGFQVLLLIKDVLGCNMSYQYTDHWSKNDTHSGLIGALVVEEAELASTPILFTEGRLKYLTGLTVTGGFRSVCLFRTPRNTDMRGDVFLKPFSGTVWILFMVFLIVLSLFLWSTFIVEYRRMNYFLGYVPSFLSTCLISFGSACVQGSSIIPLSIGGRVAFISLYLITFIMYNYYTSIVVSSLLGSPVKSDIKTLGQLADSSLEVGLEPYPYTYMYLNNSQLPEVRRFVKRKVDTQKNPHSVYIPTEEGILRVRDIPGYVFIFEASSGYSLVEKFYEPHEICDLNEILFRSDTTLYNHIHKNSSYKEITRLRTLRLLETGVYAKHYRHWIKTRLNCFDDNFLIAVGMEYTAPLFFMLIAAYFLVLILLLIEIFYKRYTNKKQISLIWHENVN